ncbi:hypothetical protein AVEN_270980-1 [Araneus ventricosus]|uniref:Protein FAR1-RELATED SEQUENCE n=1 Tax=Araneus ventricosus TaxID=182803 RepID=A0A4Y2WTE0_ARAVE|nr:hypothetical protein AVEN_270980-1 [Araneus ventricosus]
MLVVSAASRMTSEQPVVEQVKDNVRNSEECGKWALEFGDATKAKWNSRSSDPNGERFVCCKKFVCHHSGFMKVSVDANKRNFSKNSNCNATINIKVKLDTATTRRKDSFIQKGVLAVITIFDVHNHSLNTAEALTCLPSSGCKEKFIDYFNDGMGITEACKYHERILQLEEYKEEDMANSAINHPYRAVQHWYDQWCLLHLGPRTGQGLIEVN